MIEIAGGLIIASIVVNVGALIYEFIFNHLSEKYISEDYHNYYGVSYDIGSFIRNMKKIKEIEDLWSTVPQDYTYKTCQVKMVDDRLNIIIQSNTPVTSYSHLVPISLYGNGPSYNKIDFYNYLKVKNQDTKLIKELLDEYNKTKLYKQQLTDILSEDKGENNE